MDTLLQRQQMIAEGVEKILLNYRKDSAARKTSEYAQKRLDSLQALWDEFKVNHEKLLTFENQSNAYFTDDVYQALSKKYEFLQPEFLKLIQLEGPAKQPVKGVFSKTDELMCLQTTNFRAFSRMLRNLDVSVLNEKWEIDDKLQTLQSRWRVIDETHWQLDNLLFGSDLNYEVEFSKHETDYEHAKRELNRKLNITAHQQRSLPPVEIPTFTGNYAQWPTFMDLYSEAIHNNTMLSTTQKMQHLKGKLRGEAERIVQHLSVSADNYDACWEILTHRYNNKQLLFTKQIQAFMSQTSIQQQSSYELKRLYDTSLETIHAINNLGINTTSWDPILVHILTGKLDTETYSSYMEARKEPRELPSFDEFMEFLQRKFTALEPVNKKKQQPVPVAKPILSAREFNSSSPRHSHYNNNPKKYFGKTYHVTAERKCPMCKGDHALPYCNTFKQLQSETKLKTMAQLNLCTNCMFSHNGQKCTSIKRCRVCNNAHHTSLHDVLREAESLKPSGHMTPRSPPAPAAAAAAAPASTRLQTQRNANHVANESNEVLLATAQLKIRSVDGTYLTLRCLLDQGSQINLITESAAQRLGLQRRKQNATISGIGFSANQSNGTIQLVGESLLGDYTFTTEALVMSKMLNNLPNYSFKKQNWSHLHNIHLADPDYNISRPVDILLDAAIYADIVMTGILKGSPEAPIAQQTKLGWVLMGNVKTFNCHVILNQMDDFSRFWEMEEITEGRLESPENNYCETLYNNTTERLEDGRYVVKIPMKPNFEQHLGTSKPQAVAQFRQLEKRLTNHEEFSEHYKEFINEYLRLGHMKKCSIQKQPSCFLPHHGVLRPDSTTTKLRAVFNASAKTSSGHSLNELMEGGPNIQQDLQTIILRWRAFQYVYIADIEKFYRQVLVCEEDQHLQKIVWRDSEDQPITEHQLCTITYGTKAAPFLAMRTIKQLIKDDGSNCPLAATILEQQLYVDDLLGGSNSLKEAKTTQNQLINLMKGGGFNLRKWASNSSALLENLPRELIHQNMLNFKHADTNKTLGINWNPCTDHFTYKHDVLSKNNKVTTKRTLLSDVSKLYDPLGWLSPVTMKAKLIFQQTWKPTTSWDDALPESIQNEWQQFRQDLFQINNIVIPRWIGNTNKAIELHGFSDASEKGYACAIYCKSMDENNHCVIKLVAGKTKLAPVNKLISLPKLELCGAALLSRLMKKTIESTNMQTVTVHGWTDSMVVLGWLNGNPSRWKPFVSNRVLKVTENMPPSCWKHVKSEENPVDCASRGLTPSQLISHPLWWEGPSWLKSNYIPIQTTFETNEEERKTKQVCSSLKTNTIIEDLLHRYSSMTRVTRILSWIHRFINNTMANKIDKTLSHLTTSELENAHSAIIRAVQNIYFAEDIARLQRKTIVRRTSNILNLNPTLDSNGILRVGGRLEHAHLDQSQKHPIILPYNSKLTELLIDQAHIYTLHGGARLTLSYLRNRYWIVSGMRAVKKQLLKCVRCHRFKQTNNNQLMADLPPPRVIPSRPFTHTAVDFSGCVEVKSNKGRGIKTSKGYVAIFVCLCTKAIHLELVSDLSTAAFLNALKRLCARRGTPRHIYSDNGTNFVGAARQLEKQYQEALTYYITEELLTDLAERGIEWHFNAPSWPSAGGLWEAAVKSMKHHLKRVLGDQKLTYEEFSTLLTQIEACLNSRPLIAPTENLEDLDCITPAHILIGDSALAPPLSVDDEHMNLSTRWQLTEKMFKSFWKKWSADYLQTLQQRSKWHFPSKNLEVDDIVLIKEDNIPPAKWILGRIIETHPGPDGRVRVATLKTRSSTLKRPVTKLARLPIEQPNEKSNGTEQPDKQPETAKGSHRKINKNLYNVFHIFLIIFTMLVGPSSQQTTNITYLAPNRLIYFDKVADLQVKQDEWKMVVFYNTTTYWRSLTSIQNYVKHLSTLSKTEAAFLTISAQFQHELNEIQHYNNILNTEHGAYQRLQRFKRGLVDGVGYIANSLFGLLDERFAKQYEKDINIIQSNENHLLRLYKNHTSIIESEYNLLKRNEEVMNKQFLIIEKHLAENQERISANHENAMYVTANALAINLMISNIRRIQQMLLDLVTDARNGRIDTHLIKPEQFELELNIISGQLSSDLSLPCVIGTRDCTRQLYKLARVHVHLTSALLIFEVKLPLINNEQYELNRIIPIPEVTGSSARSLKPTTEYLAVNLRKDLIVPLENKDVSSCIHSSESQLLCAINKPTYDIKVAKTLCEAQIINNGSLSACRAEVSDCTDRWVRLHNRGTWLFSCCEECTTRIFCPNGMTTQHLHGTGIITLGLGCLLKGDSFTIHARNDYHSSLKISSEAVQMSESSINHVLSDANHTLSFVPEDHREILQGLKTKIDMVKEQQQTLSVQSLTHETHNYILYSICSIIIICFIIWGLLRIKRRYRGCSVNLHTSLQPAPGATPPQEQHLPQLDTDVDSVIGEVIVTAARKLDKASSP